MGLLDKALGNAQTADVGDVEPLIGPILVNGENITHAFVVGSRDLLIFTTLRLMSVDKTGMTGKKKHIFSTSWKNVLSWTVTTLGSVDIDRELTLHIRGMGLPMVINFPKKTDINAIAKTVGERCLS